jgi:hypothetical protein
MRHILCPIYFSHKSYGFQDTIDFMLCKDNNRVNETELLCYETFPKLLELVIM